MTVRRGQRPVFVIKQVFFFGAYIDGFRRRQEVRADAHRLASTTTRQPGHHSFVGIESQLSSQADPGVISI